LRANPRFDKALRLLHNNNQVISTAGERIGKIVQSLKNFARLDEAEFKRVDIHEGIESTLTLVDHEFRGRVEVIRDFTPPLRENDPGGELSLRQFLLQPHGAVATS
jgi:C4-dicarboxylate-specific signal transduction histidine kinase